MEGGRCAFLPNYLKSANLATNCPNNFLPLPSSDTGSATGVDNEGTRKDPSNKCEGRVQSTVNFQKQLDRSQNTLLIKPMGARWLPHLVYALMYFRAKCLLKVIFLFIPTCNSGDEKKRDCIFF